jgi:hypothetical protein
MNSLTHTHHHAGQELTHSHADLGQHGYYDHPEDQHERVHELTHDELQAVPEGTVLHWTNWPGRPSQPVTRVRHEDGNIRFASGKLLFAMPDELTLTPRAGLEVH